MPRAGTGGRRPGEHVRWHVCSQEWRRPYTGLGSGSRVAGSGYSRQPSALHPLPDVLAHWRRQPLYSSTVPIQSRAESADDKPRFAHLFDPLRRADRVDAPGRSAPRIADFRRRRRQRSSTLEAQDSLS
jgi:hypothetical protein